MYAHNLYVGGMPQILVPVLVFCKTPSQNENIFFILFSMSFTKSLCDFICAPRWAQSRILVYKSLFEILLF